MISIQKRFLFVHIPKTAGNSIQSALRDYSEDQLVALRKEQDGIERFGLRNPKYNVKKHSTLGEYRDALGNEQSRIILHQHKVRKLGTGRNSGGLFPKLCRLQTICDSTRVRKTRLPTSIISCASRIWLMTFAPFAGRSAFYRQHYRDTTAPAANIIRNTTMMSFANWCARGLPQRSSALVISSKKTKEPTIFRA